MLRHVAAFEIRYQLKSPVFWGTAVVFFLLAFATVGSDELRIGWGGQVFRNSPYAVTVNSMLFCVFGIFIAAAFASTVVLRDDETAFGPLIQATRLSKFDYLFGRLTGGFVTACLAYLSVPLGMMAALLWPGIDPDTVGPFHLADYIYAYFLFCVPVMFVMSAGFFALSTITRSTVATYVGALFVLILYLFARAYLTRPEFGAMATLLDPLGISTVSYETKSWTAAERNTLLPPVSALMWQNRALWGALAFALLALTWRSFTRKGFAKQTGGRPSRRVQAQEAEAPVAAVAALTIPQPPSRRALGWGPLASLTRFELSAIFRSPAFLVLTGLSYINSIVSLWLAGDDKVSVVYPVTRVMVQTLFAQFTTIPLFIAAFYAGELMWRDRERRVNEIVDATPSPDWAFMVPKILAIVTALLAMGVISVASAISVQLLKGFGDLQLANYLTWFLLPWFISMVLYTVLAVFIQALVPHKFVGLLVMLLYFILQLTLPTLGFDDNLYIYASTPPVPLSDMNGLGNFTGYAGWYRAYWCAAALLLAVLTYGLWRRGASAPLMRRIVRLPRRLAGVAGGLAALSLVAMLSLGGYIYYNTRVLNDHRSFVESQRWAADYEKSLLKFGSSPQPTITDVTLDVDLFPDASRVVTKGRFTVQNQTGTPLREVHVSWIRGQEKHSFLGTLAFADLQMRSLVVAGAHLSREFPDFHYRIYTFDKPLLPGETTTIDFETLREQRGFRNSNNDTRVVANGTFLDSTQLAPWLGVPHYPLLQDRATRRKYGLPADLKLATLEDQSARAFSYVRHDSGWVNADVTVSAPADQTVISSGQQLSSKVVNGRRISHFHSEAPIQDFIPVLSARYAVRMDTWNNVGLEVYYHPPHAYNIDRMISIMKDSLRYYSANFGPYQFKDLRIVEFPAYNNFAQAFPGVIPFSEAAGFIINSKNADVDYVTYVTAHEIGHQWWAHQVIGADMQGSTVLSETLAEYSALMVMEKRYGAAHIRRFLSRSLNGYLSARGKENIDEPTLERVEEQSYVRYSKGGLVMYLLRDRLGEAAVNRALRSLVQKFAFKAAPYPTSGDLIAALRAEARPADQQLITDLFQRITLYDLRVVDAQATKRADGKWAVTMTVEAHKRYANGKGVETEAPLNGLFDVGVFSADPSAASFSQANILSMQSRTLQSGRRRIAIVVDKEPGFVGLDPYVKYIDRSVSDNIKKIDKK